MFKRLTPEQMAENEKKVADEFDDKLCHDEKFAEAVLIIGKWWLDNYMKCGHKRLARLLLQEVKN